MSEFADAYCAAPSPELQLRASAVRALVLDVDGVLTDGRVHIGEQGEPFKAFHIHDGKGISMMRKAGHAVAIVTARRSGAVARRAEELGIIHVRQGVAEKGAELDALAAELGIPGEALAYVGDDLVDLAPMSRAGLAVAVADAHPRVRRAAHWVTERPGGRGAVREVCELILGARGQLQRLINDHA
jgi:3-deoxy-D-manno-octulosonate 8-phosphate phosphatase (KDO 8-P phosphatase)